MKVAISSGHGAKIRGASGILDEVNEARRVVPAVCGFLRAFGVECAEFHDDTSTSQSQNLSAITSWHNSLGPHDYDMSCHFNAFEPTNEPMGVEVLWKTQEDLAGIISAAIADAGKFKNRGAKYRGDLAFLNNTQAKSVLWELCFVDSEADAALYEQYFPRICFAIARAIARFQP
jgi:N-acetylmuramoyl-L-alanine amidase